MRLEDFRVADGLRALRGQRAVQIQSIELAVELHALLAREDPLLRLQLIRDIEQPHLDVLGAHHLRQKRQMIAEEEDGLRIVDRLALANELLEEDRRHRRDVLVAEANVRTHETLIAGLHSRNADLLLRRIEHPVPREDLLGYRHRALLRRHDRHCNEPLQPRHVVVEQAPVLDDAARDAAFATRELLERDLLAIPDPLDQREVRTREHAEILAVLAIDPLDTLGDHDLDPRVHLRVGRCLARRSLPAPRARCARDESARAHGAAHHWEFLTGLEAEVGKIPERLVEVVADVGRGDLVGRDVVPQLRMRRRSSRGGGVEREIFTRELAMQQRRILREQEDASIEANAVRDLMHGARAKTLDHTSEDAGGKRLSQATQHTDTTKPGA